MYKKGRYIVARFIAFLLMLILGITVALQSPFVQTKITKAALEKFGETLDGYIQYDNLEIMSSGVLLLRNALIIDKHPYREHCDTFISAETITATFTLKGLLKKEGIHLGHVTVENGFWHFIYEPGDYHYNMYRIFGTPYKEPADTLLPAGPALFDIRKAWVKNMRFMMTDYRYKKREVSPGMIDFQDLDVTADLKARNISMKGGRLYATIDRLSAKEKSGYEITHLSGKGYAGQGKVDVSNLRLTDPWSDLKLKKYSQSFNSLADYQLFVDRTMQDAEFSKSRVALETISYFSGTFKGSKSVFEIKKGHARGYVNDFEVDNIVFTELNSGVSGMIEGRAVGVEAERDFFIDGKVHDLRCNSRQLSEFITGFAPDTPVDIGFLAPGKSMILEGTAKGPMNRLDARISMKSAFGRFNATGSLRNVIDTDRDIYLDITMNTHALNMGAVFSNDNLGECDMLLKGSIELHEEMPDIILDTLAISRLHAFDLDYSGIHAKGYLADGSAQGVISSNDPNLDMNLSAAIDLKDNGLGRLMIADGTIRNADITPLKITSGSGRSYISASLKADFYNRNNFTDGTGTLGGIVLTHENQKHDIGDIQINAYRNGDNQELILESGFLEASYTGESMMESFVSDIMNNSVKREFSVLFNKKAEDADTRKHQLDIHMHDSRDILSIFAPGVYIADSTMVSIAVNRDGAVNGSIISNRLAFSTNYLKNVEVSFNNYDGSINADINGSELKAGPVMLTLPEVNLFADDNSFSSDIRFDTSSMGASGGDGLFMLEGKVYRDSTGTVTLNAHPLDSYLIIGGKTWNINNSEVILSNGDIKVNDLRLASEEEYISIDGGISSHKNDSLAVKINGVDLALANDFLSGFDLGGFINGKAILATGPAKASEVLMDVSIDSLSMGGYPAGTLRVSSLWDDSRQAIGIYINDRLDDRDILKASGYYTPDSEEVEMVSYIDGFPLSAASVILKDIARDIAGDISGYVSLMGPVESMSARSRNLRLNNAKLTLVPTGVSYLLDGPLRVDNNGIFFESVNLTDNEGGTGTIQGAVHYDHFQDFSLDARLSLNTIKVVDASEYDNSGFYGKIAVSGEASVKGPFEALSIDANLSTNGNGNIHIPVSGSLISAPGDLLTFTSPEIEKDPYEEMLKTYETEVSRRYDPSIHARLAISQDTNVYVEIDKSSGNMANFNGNGDLMLFYRPSKDILNLNGDYTINEGRYNFALQGVVTKDFTILPGSMVQFAGNLNDTNLNIDAVHTVKTSLNPIISSSSDISSRRLVECGISLREKLSRPDIEFTVNVPDIDPATKSDVDAALNTSDKVQKQFIALLVMNSFVPGELSGVFNGSSMILSSVSELMSNQINSIFQKLNIPVDIGFGYQNSTKTGANIFDLAISTQLFNNRVIVGGSVGNRKYATSGQGNFVGDLDIQVKLDRKGDFRLNLFSHSADEFTNILDNTQRNGAGFSYQREFNPHKKNKKTNRHSADSTEVIIKIENEQRKALPDTNTVRR